MAPVENATGGQSTQGGLEVEHENYTHLFFDMYFVAEFNYMRNVIKVLKNKYLSCAKFGTFYARARLQGSLPSSAGRFEARVRVWAAIFMRGAVLLAGTRLTNTRRTAGELL